MTPPTRRIVTILAGVLLFGLFAGTGKEKDAGSGEQTPSNATQRPAERQGDPEQEKHFTPEVEKFVETFKPAGEGIEGAGGIKAPSPAESLQHFRLSDGLEMEVVASEPVIRQPLNLHFDERGRLWVVQYIQYPFPAGLKVVKYDKYLRAVFDKVPLPPPNHVRGADKITILEDTDGDGLFDLHKDFLTGLNIATGVAVGRDGVWVLNPPYLLFYPDRNRDDVPDGDPEVHLSGFGIEDTHAVANSLHWGPDGWLYGVQGSTTTSHVKGIDFLGQAVWRYHPTTKAFELFAEGGGNPWTLDFDSKGRIFVGTNIGAARGLHFVQGGYYVKNWPKHGPLTNPYAFGFFPHMAHSGYQPRFSQTLVIYEGGALPNYEGQMIAGMALTNRVQASRMLKDTSSFKTEDSEAMVLSDSRWFRPVDTKVGPDGAVYIADWFDIRLSHLSPEDNWDKTNGRIYRLKAKGALPTKPFDLSRLSGEQLLGYLSHPNKWFREQTKRVLADRRDSAIVPALKNLVETGRGQLALEALWAVNLSGGWDDTFALRQLSHPDEFVRAWTVRLLGDAKMVTPSVQTRLIELARAETQVEVRSQLASSCKRLPARNALPVLRELLLHSEDDNDLHVPLLLWWALESKVGSDLQLALKMLKDPALWQSSLFNRHIASRIGQRFTAERGDRSSYTLNEGEYSSWKTNYTPERCRANLKVCSQLLDMASSSQGKNQLIRGMEQGLRGDLIEVDPSPLREKILQILRDHPEDAALVSLALRLKIERATAAALRMAGNDRLPEPDRKILIGALADLRVSAAVPIFLKGVQSETSDSLRREFLENLQRFSDAEIPRSLLMSYRSLPRHLQLAAQGVLASRHEWAKLLLESVDSGKIQPEQITESTLLTIRNHRNPADEELIRKHWGSTAQEDRMDEKLRSAVQLGEQHYRSKCSYCHLANGQGMKKSLVDSKWVQGTDHALIRIVLQGKEGEGELMPGFAAEFDDAQIASVLTYVRWQWGRQTEPVAPATVHEIRLATADRKNAWREEELLNFLK
ncbi:MAG: dehydrogenase [Acidobacteria bacterium]|nr:MAG: dehydrogenase [Acidobacteriota bacterium]